MNMFRFPPDTCVIMVGVSGSGKSTIAQKIDKDLGGGTILSSDHIREVEMRVSEYDASLNPQVFALLHERLDDRMRSGLPTVVDTTGLRADQRSRFVEIAQKHSRPVILAVCDTDVDEAWRRNVARSQQGERFVPEEAFQWQVGQLTALKDGLEDEATFYGYHDVIVIT
jgi:predicted kinase